MSLVGGGAISFILHHIDLVGANLVASTYHNMVMRYAPVMFAFTAIYIGFIFLKTMRGHYQGNDLIILVLRTVMVLTLAMNYDYFCLFVYDIFTNEPLSICKAMVINNGAVESTTVSGALDNFLNSGKLAAIHVFSMGSWSNPTYFIFGTLIFLFVLFSAAIGTGLIILAKCASTILLALSPLYLFFALFDATKGLFESYIRQLITYALVPIMTCAVLMILLSVADTATQVLNNNAQPTIGHIVPLGLMCIIQIYLLLQVKGKCAALAGGFVLPTVISAFRQTKSEWASAGGYLTSMASKAFHRFGHATATSHHASSASRQRLSRFSKE